MINVGLIAIKPIIKKLDFSIKDKMSVYLYDGRIIFRIKLISRRLLRKVSLFTKRCIYFYNF
jgi:hypothetical protein